MFKKVKTNKHCLTKKKKKKINTQEAYAILQCKIENSIGSDNMSAISLGYRKLSERKQELT